MRPSADQVGHSYLRSVASFGAGTVVLLSRVGSPAVRGFVYTSPSPPTKARGISAAAGAQPNVAIRSATTSASARRSTGRLLDPLHTPRSGPCQLAPVYGVSADSSAR